MNNWIGVLTFCIFFCGLQGTVRCWGDGDNGQLGQGAVDRLIGMERPPGQYGDVKVLLGVGERPQPHQRPPLSHDTLWGYKERMTWRISTPMEAISWEYSIEQPLSREATENAHVKYLD